MSVNTDAAGTSPPDLSDQDAVLELTGEEQRELEVLAARLCATGPEELDSRAWVEAARDASAALPLRLRRRLARFRRDPGDEAVLLVRGLPVDPDRLPPTPTVPGSVQRHPTVPAAAITMIASQLGELYAFREEKSGALVQDVVPVPGMEEFQGNAGSTELTMHIENAFHANRPDYVGLACLRNDHDNVAGLKVASARLAARLLPADVRMALHEPKYFTSPPGSFGLVDDIPGPEGIFRGNPEDPDVRVDFTSTEAIDDDAREAMAALGASLAAVARTLVLRPGDLAIVDNRLCLHGRTAFRARYDGRDRWLQRVFVSLDLRRSRASRPADGHVVHSAVGRTA
ncbi:TauD/TfdA family dioxygenase [Goodfellowiella coeruleoviolacea]|uniref:TauD/TfdA family dioxygenase n=1 Tax=Goodfellowiella coeruleoviolacea TaxID=334858 RepID=UPI003898DCD4